jgi:Flp pilus assembly protein TadB
MSDNAEEGIARVQLGQKDGLQKHQERGARNLDERNLSFLFGLVFLGLLVVWATASSPYIMYGSFAAATLVTLLFGVLRIKRIDRIRAQRALQAEQTQSESIKANPPDQNGENSG